MAKRVNWNYFERKIKEKRLGLFSGNDICHLFGSSKIAATFLLHRYSKKGFIIRLKRDLYTLPDVSPPESFIANRLVSPSYVSLEFALSYYQIIPEIVYSITSITTKSTRHFEALGKRFFYRHIKKEAFTGYQIEKEKGFSFLLADPEKAFVDFCYFKILDQSDPHFRFNKGKINWEKAFPYAMLFQNQKLVDWIKRLQK